MLGNDVMAATAPGGGAPAFRDGKVHRALGLGDKFRRPAPRAGLVPRRALVDRILAHREEPLVAVVAPPGYGKSTVLAEWCDHHDRDVVWLSVDTSDNDPYRLLAAASKALGDAGLVPADVVATVQAGIVSVPAALSILTSAIADQRSIVLALDNVDSVTDPRALDVIVTLALGLPSGSQFAYASRAPLPLPAPLLRSRRAVVEIGVEELSMDRAEAGELLANVGVTLDPDEIEDVHRATEGWPAGLYLAAIASKGRRQVVTTPFAFRGDDVLMADYLRTEVLDGLTSETVSFLTRTSVLERLSGPLCDAVLATTDAQAVLERLEAANLLIVPLDRTRTWYRYHRLLRDLLASELDRREPDLRAVLHHRAAEWLEQHGQTEDAIHHAQGSGDADLVLRLAAIAMQPSYAAGHAGRTLGWLEWFRTEGLIDRYRDVAILGAIVAALAGQPASAERWTAAAEAEPDGAPPDSPATEGRLAYLRSLLCRHGTARMRDDARRAQELLPPDDNLRAAAMFFEGVAHVLDGDLEVADPVLAHAYDVSMYVDAYPSAVGAVSLRALAAAGRGDWPAADAFAAKAIELTESHGLEEYSSAGLAYAAAARLAMHRGDRLAAGEHLARCARIRHLCTYAVPATAIIQLEIARTYLELADPAGARTVLRELRDLLHQRPDLGAVPTMADALQQRLDALRQGPIGVSSLTAAELRLVPFLATHLSFREIGERLHVSRHTVKSQAMAVYRKVGATSRSEAIVLLGELALFAT